MSDKPMSWEEAVVWLRSQPDQLELVKACYFDDPLVSAAQRFHRSSEWRAVRDLIPRSLGRALDIGAGRGVSSYALAREGWKTVALEPDRSSIVGADCIRSLAKDSGLKIDVVQESGEQLPFVDNSFELVYCRQVLHHARDLKQLCREIGRVLKPNGLFIATREHVISRREDLAAFLEQHPLHRFYGGEHAYLREEYVMAITGAGIILKKIFNPFESSINLSPETIDSLKRRIAGKIRFPWPRLIPDSFLSLLGARLSTPGRLFTFCGYKG